MRRCPKKEALLEYLTVRRELDFSLRIRIRTHLWRCDNCRDRLADLEVQWQSLFQPEPDITHSLISVFSRICEDETLNDAGWRLAPLSCIPAVGRHKNRHLRPLTAAVACVAVVVSGLSLWNYSADLRASRSVVSDMTATPTPKQLESAEQLSARMRIEEKDGVRVHYVHPELLQTIEFETGPSKRH